MNSDGRDIVTIAHEKLIEAWPWLRKLVNENRDAIALQNQIAEDAAEWEKHQRDASYLYVGARLANAREQLAAKKIVLNGLAQAFITAGVEAEEVNRAREEARIQKELDDTRNLAEEQTRAAEAANKLAEAETQRAETANRLAEEQQRLAEAAKKLAEAKDQQAEDANKLAEAQQKRAEEQTRSARRLRRFALVWAGAGSCCARGSHCSHRIGRSR